MRSDKRGTESAAGKTGQDIKSHIYTFVPQLNDRHIQQKMEI
jgi:hypothetical protein